MRWVLLCLLCICGVSLVSGQQNSTTKKVRQTESIQSLKGKIAKLEAEVATLKAENEQLTILRRDVSVATAQALLLYYAKQAKLLAEESHQEKLLNIANRRSSSDPTLQLKLSETLATCDMLETQYKNLINGSEAEKIAASMFFWNLMK